MGKNKTKGEKVQEKEQESFYFYLLLCHFWQEILSGTISIIYVWKLSYFLTTHVYQ